MQPELTALAIVHAVNEYLALRWLEEAAGKVHQRGFARAGLADDGDGRARGDVQIEVREHILAAVGIAEGHVTELDIANDGLPVLALGVEGVAVFFAHGLAVAHAGLGVEQVGDALDVCLERDELREVLGKYLHWLKDADGVGDEGRERAQAENAVEAHVPALIEHDGHGQSRAEEHKRDIYGAELCGADAGVARFGGEVSELCVV